MRKLCLAEILSAGNFECQELVIVSLLFFVCLVFAETLLAEILSAGNFECQGLVRVLLKRPDRKSVV